MALARSSLTFVKRADAAALRTAVLGTMLLFMKPGLKFAVAGLVLAIACAVGWNLSIEAVDIPENRTLFVVGFLAAAALGVTALVKGAGWIGGIISLPAIAIGALLPFTMAISPQEPGADIIQVGDTIPRFTAPDDSGQVFRSDALNGHIVLIKFFRAHW